MSRVALLVLVVCATAFVALGNPTNANGVCSIADIFHHGPGGPTPVIDGVPKTYVAGKTYQLTLTPESGNFKGFVLYANLGTMALATTGNQPANLQAASSCGDRSVEHRSNVAKTKVAAIWTAPATAGQEVRFGAIMMGSGVYGTSTATIDAVGGQATGGGTAAARTGAGATYTFKISVVYNPTDMNAFKSAFVTDMAAALQIKSSSRIAVVKTSINALGAGEDKMTDVVFTLTNPTKGTLDDAILTEGDVVDRIQIAMNQQANTQTGPLKTSTTLQSIVVNSVGVYSGSLGGTGDSGTGGGVVAIIVVAVVLVLVAAIGGYCYFTRGKRAQAKAVGGTVNSTPMMASAPVTSGPMVNTSEWSKVFDESTKSYYYFNSRTGESSWTKPPGVNV